MSPMRRDNRYCAAVVALVVEAVSTREEEFASGDVLVLDVNSSEDPDASGTIVLLAPAADASTEVVVAVISVSEATLGFVVSFIEFVVVATVSTAGAELDGTGW